MTQPRSRSFDGRYNPPPRPRPPLPQPEPCPACQGQGQPGPGETVRCGRCSGAGLVLRVADALFPATLKGRRYAAQALRRAIEATHA